MDEVDLGKRLQAARKNAGLTQQELCHKAQLSYSTLAKIERGAIRAPSIFTIQNIAHALGTNLSVLMGEASADTLPAPKKQSKSGIRFVYFDVNGCLVRFYHEAFARLAEDSGMPADIVETVFWHYNDQVCRGEMTVDELNKVFAERLKLNKVDWREYYMAAIEPIKGMQELLEWASEHYHVGLLSNIMPGFLDEMFERKILPSVTYSAIIDSSKTGAIKPEPKIYETAQDWANCPPEEILLVDDSRANLMAAERMGWRVLWFDDYKPALSVKHVKEALEPVDS